MLTRAELLQLKADNDLKEKEQTKSDTEHFIRYKLINKIKEYARTSTRCLISNSREGYYSNDAHSCYYALDLGTIAAYVQKNMPELKCKYPVHNEFIEISWE